MKRKSHLRIEAFTLIELLAVISIIAVLAVLLFPAMSAMMGRQKQVKCVANLSRLGVAFAQYVGEHNNCYPLGVGFNVGGYSGGADVWTGSTMLGQYIYPDQPHVTDRRGGSYFKCPACGEDPNINIGYGSTYSYNFFLLRISSEGAGVNEVTRTWQVPNKANTALIGCGVGGGAPVYDAKQFGFWHPSQVTNFLFADYHIEPRSKNQELPLVDFGL